MGAAMGAQMEVAACDGTRLPSKRLSPKEGHPDAAGSLFVFLHCLGESMSDYDETSEKVNLQEAMRKNLLESTIIGESD